MGSEMCIRDRINGDVDIVAQQFFAKLPPMLPVGHPTLGNIDDMIDFRHQLKQLLRWRFNRPNDRAFRINLLDSVEHRER